MSGTFNGTINAQEGVLNNVTINENCTVRGALEAARLIIKGVHQAGAAATEASNYYVVAFDNKKTTEKNAEIVNPNEKAVKRIRVAGKGQVRFRIRFRGRAAVWLMKPDGSTTNLLNNTDLGNHEREDDESWSKIVELPYDVNIVFLFGSDYSSFAFSNSIFEVRTSNEPGLFKYLSSPF